MVATHISVSWSKLDRVQPHILILRIVLHRMTTNWFPLMIVLSLAVAARADEVSLPTAEEFLTKSVVERLARKIEPDLVGKPERLPQYVNFFRSEIGNDSRLFAFNVMTDATGEGRVVLRGYVEFPETRAALAKFLGALGFAVEDQLETLPDAELGKEIFGLVKAAHSLGYDRPSGKLRPETDCLIGEPLYLLREESGHLLAHTSEGYLAYVRSADVLRVDDAAFVRYLSGRRLQVKTNQQVEGTMVPAGARLKWIGTEGDVVKAELPTGVTINVPASACEVRNPPDAQIDAIITAAQQLIGTPYLWGGRTSDGIDCSGLVQMGYAGAGLRLPRDSYQQFYVGQLTATRWHTAGMRRGDTLYFLGDDGKIRHTAIYLGDDRYLQAVLPKVRISSFNPKHPEYDEHRKASFAFAKRPLE
jgi:gamma-D-glutamyl-L-lysine dipeptidyl-peptidase